MYAMDMRQYDPAIGRWVVHDPVVHYDDSPYSAFDNNPVYFADPSGASPIYNSTTGQYVINGKEVSFDEAVSYANSGGNSDGSNNNKVSDTENSITEDINPKDAMGYQSQYPRTVQVMKQLRGYVKANPAILKALAEYSGYSSMEVLSQLEYFMGDMTLTIEDLSWDSRNPEGITLSSSDIRLKISNAEVLETLKTNKKIQSCSFFVAITILHEFVHAGRRANGLNEDAGEMGWGWEEKTFGRVVNFLSADDLYSKNKWNFKDPKKQQYPFKLSGLKN